MSMQPTRKEMIKYLKLKHPSAEWVCFDFIKDDELRRFYTEYIRTGIDELAKEPLILAPAQTQAPQAGGLCEKQFSLF